MPDLFWLADLGRASVAALWLPVAAWTAVALVAEAALRASRPGAALALPVRGAVLAALPLAVGAPALLGALAPDAVLALVPDVAWLPEVAVGGPAPSVEAVVPTGPPLAEVLLGLGMVAVVAVSLAHGVRLGAELAHVRRARARFGTSGLEAQAAVDAARSALGVARPVAAVEAPPGTAPFTVGWRRPVVALPAGLDGPAREVAAVHEVAHVRRADYAWHAAQRAVAAVFAAHPLVWALGRGLDLDRERAADALVLEACPDRRRTYADLLFSYAALPAPALALGAARGSSSLKTRIDAMTRPLSPSRARRLGHLGRALGLGALALAAGLAATTTPAAPASALDDVPDVESLVVRTADGEPSAIELSLPDGATRADAEAVLDFVASADADAVRLPVLVTFGAETLSREVPVRRGRTAFRDGLSFTVYGGAAPMGPARRALRASADTTDEVFEIVDEMPTLIGGLEALQALVVYPQSAKDDGVEGQVVLQFVVDEEGAVTDPVVLRSPDDRLAEAAVAAVTQLRFEPGVQRGRPVKVRFAVPVTFRLPGGEDRSEVLRGSVPGAAEVTRRLPHAETDLALLENQRFVDRMRANTLGILDQHEAQPGVTVVGYTMNPDGSVTDVRTVSNTGGEELAGLARGLVATFHFREDRSPPAPRDARFRLHYVAE